MRSRGWSGERECKDSFICVHFIQLDDTVLLEGEKS